MSESEQEWWLARHRRAGLLHSCGHPRGVCEDESKDWFPQLDVCRPTMERAAAQAQFEALHQDKPWHDGSFRSWAKERSASHPYHHSHGTTIWVAEEDLGHGGDFLSGAPQQRDGDHGEANDAERDRDHARRV